MNLPLASMKKCLGGLVFLQLLLAPGVQAQLSGGPYGPIERRYEVPKAAHVYYVAPDGRAEGAGSALAAPTTLDSAIGRAVTGDAIILRGGIYRTGNLVLNQGITLQPYLDEKPVLKGTEVVADWDSAGANVWRASWSKLFPSKPLPWWRREREEARTPLYRFNNDMVFIDGKYLQSVGSVQELTPQTVFIDYDGKQVYIGADPRGHTVEITAHDVALLRTTAPANGRVNDHRGPVIRGITFTQYAWSAIVIEGKKRFTHLDEPVDEPVGPADPATYGKEVVGTRLEDVTISFCSRTAGYFRGDGLVIRNSLISDTGTEGIYIIGSSNVLLERNIVRGNDLKHITGYYISAVKIIDQTHHVVVRDNLVLDSPTSNGVWYDVGNRDGVFINNYVEGVNVGFMFEISRGVTVAGNVFANNKLGSWILNSADAHLYNNTYIDNGARFTRTERKPQGDLFDWHSATGPGVTEREGHVFVNNLIVASKDSVGPLVQVGQSPAVCQQLKQPELRALDGNVYVRPGAPYAATTAPLMSWVDTNSAGCSMSFASLAVFRERVPAIEVHGRQLEGSPRSVFTAPDIRRYQLRRALPASRDAAMPQAVRELLGWSQRQAALTVGAFPAN